MSEMVERVALALYDQALREEPELDVFEADRSHWMTTARTAIAAMREPTQEMIVASNGALKVFIDSLSPEERSAHRPHRPTKGPPQLKVPPHKKSRIRYQAMIDEALR